MEIHGWDYQNIDDCRRDAERICVLLNGGDIPDRIITECAVVFILVNALRNLDHDQLVTLGKDIASRCGHEMISFKNAEVTHGDSR